MTKKILYAIFTSIAILFVSTVCFAKSEEKIETTNLGNEITSSIKNTEKSMDNLVETNTTGKKDTDKTSVGNDMKNGAKDVGNDVKNGVEDIGNDIENGFRDMTGDDDSRTTNRATAGTTGNYTSGDSLSNNNNTGMNTTTWVWIIVAVVAVIIIAAVWYYAAQK